MDSFEINKIVASILLVALLIIGISKISDLVFHVEKPEKQIVLIENNQETETLDKNKNVESEKKIDISALMSLGDIAKGEKIFKKCSACHSIEKGGKNKIGPALYNVVGRDIGSIDDYKYSKALTNYGKKWTFEELNGYLIKPASYIKGTKMAFAGLRKEIDRASVIKYLNKYSDSPKPLP